MVTKGHFGRSLLVAVLAVAALTLDGTVYRIAWPAKVSGEPVAPTAASRSVLIPQDRSSDIQVDQHWSVHVPAGSVSGASTLTIDQADQDSARLSLSSGQPIAPWTFTRRLDTPLPEGYVLYLVNDTGDGEAYEGTDSVESVATPATVHIAQMSPDRRVGTVTVGHLSFKQWRTDLIDAVVAKVGEFFGHRANPPTCQGQRPDWLAKISFRDDANSPMRVCSGMDPARPGVAVVKIVNNRGGTLIVTSPVAPTWAWQSVLGNELNAIPANLASTVAERFAVAGTAPGRTWVLPPGQEVHLGFSRDVLAKLKGPIEIVGTFTPTSMAFGLLSKIVSDALDQRSGLWDYAVILACWQSESVRAWDRRGAEGVGMAVAGVARCMVEQPEVILKVLRESLSAAAWQGMSRTLYRVANTAKKAATRYLAIAEALYALRDLAATLSLPRAEFVVALTLKSPATKVVTLVGVTKAGLPAPGYKVEDNGGLVDGCDASAAAKAPGIVACFPHAAGADVCWPTADRIVLLCGGFPWEKTLLRVQSDLPVPVTPATPDAAPWGMELAGGLKCRLRNGGAWGGRADGYVGAYYCGDESRAILTKTGPVVDKTNPTWTVRVGPLGDDNEAFPPPAIVPVVTAYFAGSP